MYQPEQHREDRLDVQHDLIETHPFGLLISHDREGLQANGLPFLLQRSIGPFGRLQAHIARANSQWRELDGAEVLVVFQGPLNYVTPAFYETKRETGKVVPTWNYAMVQARGTARVRADTEWLDTQISALTDRHEADRPEPWHVSDAPRTYIEAQLRGIVWGTGEEGEKNRKAGTPKNSKRFTSELGSVSPTIVVPGPWPAADIRFQAENIATMKLHNSGHNCIACQALIMPKGWNQGASLLAALKKVAAGSTRPAWYPGAEKRLETHAANGKTIDTVDRGTIAPPLVISDLEENRQNRKTEVFGPALGTIEFDAPDPATYLETAIAFANDELWGTLGANILIHPKTIRQIGRKRFEEIIAKLRYGTIGINGWCGLGFLTAACPWGAFPGHTLEDVGSGIGTVHNAFMLEETERVVIRAPWRPFPRGLLSGQFSLLPRPPYFITNRRQHKIGEALTRFQYKPGWLKLPGIFYHALLG